ncbi:hypothetical protein FACS1894187_17750 [Synergistales bacterium]|nr:hypothetical protein FACS1894187_17750 [Synergistales bacterium]
MKLGNGYWVAGISALTAEHKQPIPVYSRVYSTLEKGYLSNNDETLKSLKFLSSHFPETNIRAFDRGYDAGYIFDVSYPAQREFYRAHARMTAMFSSRAEIGDFIDIGKEIQRRICT